jgi:hypothetical protein
MDRSDGAAVIRFAGKPDAERSARLLNYSPYRALGYGCRRGRSNDAVELARRAPYCRTVFFLDAKTGKLELFYTASREYSEAHGLRVGTSQAVAERRLGQHLHIGCVAALRLSSNKAMLSVSFGGGTEKGTAIRGAHVDAFVLHGLRGGDPGIFDCL